ITRCATCLSELPEGGRYCPGCGAAQPAATRQTTGPYQPGAELAASRRSTDQPRFVPGQLLAGRYQVVALLGKGGMGEVYRADDLKLGQSIALKFLPAALVDEPDRLARFHHEVRIARQVSHPNVCRVYDL